MDELWRHFEGWLASHWPQGLAGLRPPATDAEIAALETALGVSLPRDFVDCLKVHNGHEGGGLFDGQEFLSTQAIAEQWQVWKDLLDSGDFDGIRGDPAGGVRESWWNARWVPFTHDGGGNHYCLDLDPAPGGHSGQVITMWHDTPERALLADSFGQWFEGYVASVLAGAYAYSEDYGALVPFEDA